MKRLFDWLRNYIKKEYRKVRLMGSTRERVLYIWNYYKIEIIVFFGLIFLIVYFSVNISQGRKDQLFFALFANTNVSLNDSSELHEDFAEYVGMDPKTEKIDFNSNSYFNPETTGYNEYYSAFVAYVDSGELDVVVMEVEDIESLGTQGRLLDLSNTELAGDIAEKYADRLLYATPIDEEYSTEPIPIGLDISDSILMTEYGIYPDDCAIGISAETSRLDMVETFLDYILPE